MQIDSFIPQIRSASREMVRQFGLLNNHFSSIGSNSQCHALIELDSRGVMNLGQLSTSLNLDKSTASRLVTQLCEKGICQIQPDENDRRNKLISLTQKGSKLVNEIHREANLQVKLALDMMSTEEQAVVLKGLTVYTKALKRSRLHNEYTVRKLQKKDIPQLVNLIKAVWSEFGFDSSHPQASIFEDELHRTHEAYICKKSNYYVLVSGRKIVGGIGFAPLINVSESICELKGMYLSSQLRGLGLGSLLLKKALHKAQLEGFKKCYLETMHFMHGANTLYKKFGFKKLDKPIGNTGHNWTNCWYIKTLDESDMS
jgi:putative acetyltransferase